jgi:hypothetical protein
MANDNAIIAVTFTTTPVLTLLLRQHLRLQNNRAEVAQNGARARERRPYLPPLVVPMLFFDSRHPHSQSCSYLPLCRSATPPLWLFAFQVMTFRFAGLSPLWTPHSMAAASGLYFWISSLHVVALWCRQAFPKRRGDRGNKVLLSNYSKGLESDFTSCP